MLGAFVDFFAGGDPDGTDERAAALPLAAKRAVCHGGDDDDTGPAAKRQKVVSLEYVPEQQLLIAQLDNGEHAELLVERPEGAGQHERVAELYDVFFEHMKQAVLEDTKEHGAFAVDHTKSFSAMFGGTGGSYAALQGCTPFAELLAAPVFDLFEPASSGGGRVNHREAVAYILAPASDFVHDLPRFVGEDAYKKLAPAARQNADGEATVFPQRPARWTTRTEKASSVGPQWDPKCAAYRTAVTALVRELRRDVMDFVHKHSVELRVQQAAHDQEKTQSRCAKLEQQFAALAAKVERSAAECGSPRPTPQLEQVAQQVQAERSARVRTEARQASVEKELATLKDRVEDLAKPQQPEPASEPGTAMDEVDGRDRWYHDKLEQDRRLAAVFLGRPV